MATGAILTDKFVLCLRTIVLIIPFLYGCNYEPKKEIPGVPYNPSDYFQTYTYTVVQPSIDTINPFLMAKGKGWFCYFYAYKIRFLYNNLKDSFITEARFESSIRNNAVLNPMTIGSKADQFFIQIDPDYNPESNDTSRAKKIIISLDRKVYQGYVTDVRTQ